MGWTTVISFVLKNWKYFAILLTGVFVGVYITTKIYSIKYHDLQNQYNGCVTSLNGCLLANEENQKTIEALQKEIKLKNKSCEERINYYKNLIKRMQNIDNLTGGQSEKPVVNNCPDDVCIELYRMFK